MVELPTKQRIALQAKRYKNHINLQHLINFSQTVRTHGCSKGYFIHCGKSGQAIYQNLPENITLISGATLHRLLVSDFWLDP
ncbi:TPA: restriction endonuclease [Legionella pneumophila]